MAIMILVWTQTMAFSFISKLAVEAHKNRIRSSPIELLIGPSICYKGHGSSPEIFKVGAGMDQRSSSK
ncbi:MAG: hypothetical protein P0S93_03435 [Candidatus Neptunochlamydia sp.]|nr:hypothetical protein [Candidatus Neptunochlamydia sp.]